jgi:uncharacterized protein YecE (DUF72 family)
MEFGKVSLPELNASAFALPPDPPLTTQVLSESKREGKLQVYVGCATWGHKDWKGHLFPPKIQPVDFLQEYVKHFNSIELNATHYKMYGADRVKIWKEKAAANPDFKFCPKFPSLISHMKRLKNADELTTDFFNAMFIQVHENYSPASFTELKAYLESLPRDLPIFTEVRHKDWFAQPSVTNALFETMHQLNHGAMITDTAGRRDAVHMYLTIPHAFIRFVGNGLHGSDYERIDQWVTRLKLWSDQGLQSVYLGMHQSNERASPDLCDYFIVKMNEKLGLDIARPKMPGNNQTLF